MMLSKIRYFFKKKIIIVIGGVILFLFSFWGIFNSTNYILNQWFVSLDLRAKIFDINGNSIISSEEMINLICKTIQPSGNSCISQDNILYVSPWHIRKLLKANFHWIKEIIVMRQIPNKFQIKIKEYTPIAIWNNKLVLDIEGKMIDDSQFIIKNSNKYIQAKSNSVDSFMSFINAIIDNNDLFNNIKTCDYVNNRRWDVTLKSGLVIKLPEIEPAKALLKLIKTERKLLTTQELKMVDIRVKNKKFITE